MSTSDGKKPNPFNKTNHMKDLLKQEQTLVDYSDNEIVSSDHSTKKEEKSDEKKVVNQAIKFEN